MKLKDIDFDEFVEWMGKLEEDPRGTEDLMMEAASEVPVIERLLMIMQNARDSNAPEDMIRRNADQIQCFAALYQIEKNKICPNLTSEIRLQKLHALFRRAPVFFVASAKIGIQSEHN